MKWIFLLCCLVFRTLTVFAAMPAKQYVFFGRDREGIYEKAFYDNKNVDGAQITYAWKQLEHGAGEYDFSIIREDLAFLKSRDKKLFIQLQDVTFDSTLVAVPAYLRKDTAYHGGIAAQYAFDDDEETHPRNEGWTSRRWDPAVAQRFHALLKALGAAFDGEIEGINLQETAVEYGTSGKFYPDGFTPEKYLRAIKANMLVLRQAFPKTVAVQYANFMPGQWLPGTTADFLDSIYSYALQIKLGVGGPDVLVNRPGQMKNSYRLIRGLKGQVVVAMAVQDGNYSIINVKTGKQVTIREIYDFATNDLKADYIFWCREEPFFTEKVMPFLKQAGGKR